MFSLWRQILKAEIKTIPTLTSLLGCVRAISEAVINDIIEASDTILKIKAIAIKIEIGRSACSKKLFVIKIEEAIM